MTLQDALAALAALPDDTKITFSIEKGDLARALGRTNVAADVIDTDVAALQLGYTADRWRRWCKAGKIAGAWQDAVGGSWHMPRESCTRHLASLQQRGTKPPAVHPIPSERRQPRGPRRAAHTLAGEPARLARGPRLHGRPTVPIAAETQA